MLKEILNDFYKGLLLSIRIDLFIKSLLNNPKFENIVIKIFYYNFIIYIVPLLVKYFMENLFNSTFDTLFFITQFGLSIFSFVFHIIHYTDLVRTVSINSSKTVNTVSLIDTICIAVTMIVYQMVIYLLSIVFSYIFVGNFYFLAVLLNFLLLTIYHSFFCFNNLWNYKKIEISRRIDIVEKMWPLYIAYGTIVTIIYLYSTNNYMKYIYNTYSILIISVPFLYKPIYPTRNMPYPKINLRIFSNITNILIYFCNYLLGIQNSTIYQ